MTISWQISVIDELGSTQNSLREMKETAEGFVLQALTQTHGHGRHGRKWDGGAGNLALSFILNPDGAETYVGLISLLCGLAVHRAVKSFMDAPLMLKWPNDVLLDGRKCAGILLERDGTRLIVGIGVNIASAPQGASALVEFESVERDRFRDVLLQEISELYALWGGGEYAEIVRAWKEVGHPSGAALSVKIGQRIVTGHFEDMDAHGNLLLSDEENEVQTITAGDVYILGASDVTGN